MHIHRHTIQSFYTDTGNALQSPTERAKPLQRQGFVMPYSEELCKAPIQRGLHKPLYIYIPIERGFAKFLYRVPC